MARKKFDTTSDLNFVNADDVINKEASAEFRYIPTVGIKPSPYNEGIDLNEEKIEEYKDSMKKNGLLEPIVVYDLGNGNYELLSGHQRLAAWKALGNDKIKAVVRPYENDPLKRFEQHSEANTITRRLDVRYWQSRIKIAKELIQKEKGYKPDSAEEREEVLKLLGGMSKSQYYRYDSFKKLIPELQQMETDKWLSANTLYLASSLNKEQQKEVAVRILKLRDNKITNDNPFEDFEITRDEFKRICNDVKKDASSEVPVRKIQTYADKTIKAKDSLIKIIGSPKTDQEKKDALNTIRILRAELNEIEKTLV